MGRDTVAVAMTVISNGASRRFLRPLLELFFAAAAVRGGRFLSAAACRRFRLML
jgi:hypothetical protein